MQRSLHNTADATEATCNMQPGTHAACCTPRDLRVQHPSASIATEKLLAAYPFDSMQHATAPWSLQCTPYDTRRATAAATNEDLRIRRPQRPRAPMMRTQLQASGEERTNRGPCWQPEPNSRKVKHHYVQNMRALTASEGMHQSASYVRGTPHYAHRATHTPHCQTSAAEYAALNTQRTTCTTQHALCQQQRCGHKHCTCANATCIAKHPACDTQCANMQRTPYTQTPSECNMDYPTDREDRCHTHTMQLAHLSATRIAHRRRACDAAALELN
jgi:hypothetical protein